MLRSRPLFLAALSLAAASTASLAACQGDAETETETTPGEVPSGSAAAMVRAAVALGSCVPDDGVARTLRDLYDDALFPASAEEKPFRAQIACFGTTEAKGCAAVEECLGIRADLTGPCEKSCDGSVWTTCDDSLKFTWDCGKLGLECSAQDGCVAEAPIYCDQDTFTPMCVDDVPVYCAGEVESRGACGEYDLACVAETEPDAGGGRAYCKGKGATCEAQPDPDGTTGFPFAQGIACDGASLRACVNGGEHTYDCAAVGAGFTCQAPAEGFPFCGLAAECDPSANERATCDGTKITFCNAGKRDAVDCVALGFTGCAEPENARGAVCVPSVYGEAP